jgi:hypothetical protein
MIINFYSDSGHGWGEIPVSLIEELRLSDKISNYSYRKMDNAYLEEDCDLPMVLKKLKDRDITFSFNEMPSNGNCWVRSLKRFQV